MSDNISKHHVCLQKKQNKAMFIPWKCHYCGRNGHVKPYGFKLYGYLKQPILPKSNHVVTEWRPKVINASHIVHTTLRALTGKKWYFDSGCSRHMTGVKKYLVDIKSYSTSFFHFL